jgi:hypothetical protein
MQNPLQAKRRTAVASELKLRRELVRYNIVERVFDNDRFMVFGFAQKSALVLLVGALSPDAAVPAGERVFAAGLVHSCLRPLSLPPSSHVARRCPPSFRSFGDAEAEAPLG